jgi:8-oxo-dGTP pyrophosphatase MutT (NUDIX family)
MARKSHTLRIQAAALPWRRTSAGSIEVMLVTSRETRRLIVPKGWIGKGLPPPAVAAKEAFEEAGLHGVVAPLPCGTYEYVKRLDDGADVRCRVEVYPLAVSAQADDFPEKGQRMLHWFPPSLAAELADDEGLGRLMGAIARGDIRLG